MLHANVASLNSSPVKPSGKANLRFLPAPKVPPSDHTNRPASLIIFFDSGGNPLLTRAIVACLNRHMLPSGPFNRAGFRQARVRGRNASFAITVVVSSGDRQRHAKLGLEYPLQFIELVPYAQHLERFEIDDAARVTLVVIVLRHSIIE